MKIHPLDFAGRRYQSMKCLLVIFLLVFPFTSLFAKFNESDCNDIWVLITQKVDSTHYYGVYLSDSRQFVVHSKSALKEGQGHLLMQKVGMSSATRENGFDTIVEVDEVCEHAMRQAQKEYEKHHDAYGNPLR